MDPRRRFVPGAIDYDRSLATSYCAGRGLSPQTTAVWRAAAEPFIPATGHPTILDLGAGTGRFAAMLAGDSRARVIEVEPSLDMLLVAARERGTRELPYVVGCGEAIPLRAASCDVAWLSHVFHHLRDRDACAGELRRVLRPGGRVLLRGTFSDRLDGYPTLFRFFPGARRTCEDLPTTADAVALFERERFTLEADLRVRQQTCGSLHEFVDRTSKRADSSLLLLSDDEFNAGLAAAREAAALEHESSPIVETVDLLVFHRGG